MKQFSCGDIVPGCTAKYELPTEAELMAAVAAHARDVHGIQEVSPQMADEVRTRIRTVDD
jgi:predicted small metal-binding protein